jgi:hypothetical protein
MRRPAEAEDAYRLALRHKPDYPKALCNLAFLIKKQGRFTEALALLQRGHALGEKDPRWPYPSAEWVRQAERLVDLDARLPQFLTGQAEPADAAERLVLAQQICQAKKLYATAVRYYKEAFADRPVLAGAALSDHRYDAACAAALAGCGQGQDAANLGPEDTPAFAARLSPGCGPTSRPGPGAWTRIRKVPAPR